MAYALVGRLGCLLFLFSQGRYPVEMEGLAAGMVLTIGSATYSHLSQSISMVQTCRCMYFILQRHFTTNPLAYSNGAHCLAGGVELRRALQ